MIPELLLIISFFFSLHRLCFGNKESVGHDISVASFLTEAISRKLRTHKASAATFTSLSVVSNIFLMVFILPSVDDPLLGCCEAIKVHFTMSFSAIA